MRLQPFVKVDDTPFDANRARIERTWGAPRAATTNGIGLIELDYGRAVFRFQASSGRLEEVTKRAPVLYLVTEDGVADVPFSTLEAFVRKHDSEASERADFVVSPRLGLAFVPAEPDWVTALAAHCIATWRKLR
jgi:hypothetical protein